MIREILIITNSYNIEAFKRLLDGSQWGIEIQFKIQKDPDGLAQSFIIGADFIKDNSSCLILGDNLFYGFENNNSLEKAMKKDKGGTIFAYQVSDPERYGVVEFNNKKQVISIEEKPSKPLSEFVVTGLYFYDKDVVDIAKDVIPSKEVSWNEHKSNIFIKKSLEVELMYQGMVWRYWDFDSYMKLQHLFTLLKKTRNKGRFTWRGIMEKGWISSENLETLASIQNKSGYGTYLKNLIDKDHNYWNEINKFKNKQNNYFKDIKIIYPEIFSDNRGYFYESWNKEKFNLEIPNFNLTRKSFFQKTF